MKSLAIIGSQWGDEGKGKITDLIGQRSDLVVRYQGGNNAGHTIIVDDKKTVLHLIPSGILHDHVLSVIGHGVVFDPGAFVNELNGVKESGVKVTPEKLLISGHCTIITPYNKILDAARESQGPIKIGTTGKGIGPAYEDKVSRKAVKLIDLLDYDRLVKKLDQNIIEKKVLLEKLYQVDCPSVESVAKELFEVGKQIKEFVGDSFSVIDRAILANKKILFEGAQGVLLDIDYGSYPFVTSSNTSFGGIYTGAGIPGSQIDEVLGITKAYTTRVGSGPFPCELETPIGEHIQQKGGEFGATTGRKRRCGWLDLPLLKYTVKASNLTSLALTKLDILSDLPELKVCTGYKTITGDVVDCAYPGLDLSEVEPIYQEMTPFTDDFKTEDLSQELKNFIGKVEEFVNVPVGILAYGPERKQIQFRKDYF
ncbi:MAG: adenylosuccinate synthase [Bacteriovoracaceae bacterium]